MAEQYKQSSRIALDESITYSDSDLKKAFESFVQEEPKQSSQSIINFPSMVGFGMVLVAIAYFINSIIPGMEVSATLADLITVLPVIGGILVTVIGLGWFSRNKKKKNKKEEFNPDFLRDNSFWNKSKESTKNYQIFDRSTKQQASSNFDSAYYDKYALKKSKKLFKSISDKKIFGVCGGLAKYLGVSSTFLRLLFVIATFMGYGSPILLYNGLSIILPKEPRILAE